MFIFGLLHLDWSVKIKYYEIPKNKVELAELSL
jgi:hypothetical protein